RKKPSRNAARSVFVPVQDWIAQLQRVPGDVGHWIDASQSTPQYRHPPRTRTVESGPVVHVRPGSKGGDTPSGCKSFCPQAALRGEPFIHSLAPLVSVR